MACCSEYLQNTQPASPQSDTDSVLSEKELHERALAGLGLKDAGGNGKKNTIVKVHTSDYGGDTIWKKALWDIFKLIII